MFSLIIPVLYYYGLVRKYRQILLSYEIRVGQILLNQIEKKSNILAQNNSSIFQNSVFYAKL